ncbi:hypothetical protein FH972_023609 [Carpinus fangiana]|uniref:Uncharacterized protein n=1 Tax=Carpinus fangiana TaxID=176857 RepID=A0A5N6KVN7_9ROSI|nr:hypothetical protein FH972_023609 [Carpinus fangiana]
MPQYDGSSDVPSQARITSMTPAKAAYAGPTFHASPAASTLPIPSRFFSKSMPSDQPASSLQNRLEADSENQSPRPCTAASEHESESDGLKVPPREESPLDFFFNAQKAERSGNRSSPLAGGVRPNGLQQPASVQRFRAPPPRGTPNPSKNMFMMELDGSGEGNDMLPDISSPVPFKDRMQAVRSNSSSGHIPGQHNDFEAERLAKTLELKKLLSVESDSQQDDQHQQSDRHYGQHDSGSPFSSSQALHSGPHPAYHEGRHVMPPQYHNQVGGNTGLPRSPSCSSPSRDPYGGLQSQYPAELPGSTAYTGQGHQHQHQHATPPRGPPIQQSDGHQGSKNGASGFHNQISSVRQMEDSLRKILKLDDIGGK